MRAWLVIPALVGCGDNLLPAGQPLGRAADVTIVAHQDDDLLFIQPDLYDLTRRGSLTNVYVTAGDGNHGLDNAEERVQGLLVAYSRIVGKVDWRCGLIDVDTHPAEHCRLDDANLSLVFLGYPDGGKEGQDAESLQRLWRGELERATTVAKRRTTYTREQLIDAIATIIEIAKPHTVRTLEIASTHGHDHSDHRMVGALTVIATARSTQNPELISFRGYSTATEPVNMIEPLFLRSRDPLAHYTACANDCAACGDACENIPAAHDEWLHRRYAIGMRPAGAGQLRDGSGTCLDANPDGTLAMSACETAASTTLAADGTLRIGDRCVQLVPTGELVATTDCTPAQARRFFLDDEGHVWLGLPPPTLTTDTKQLLCLDATGGRPRSSLCGADHAPTWELWNTPTSTVHPAGLTRTGRAVRLADIDGDRRADLCAIEPTGLRCARGDGAGGFAAATAIAALSVEPESLAIGDVDGDGVPDACGRTPQGVSCAIGGRGFTVQPWNPAFGHPGGPDASDRSLAAVDADGNGAAEICGLSTAGVQCAGRGLVPPPVLSPWPDRGAPLWPGDLDGDRRADWCVATPTGAACGLDRHRGLTTDGVPWAYSFMGAIEAAPVDANLGALADIDGDGRADLCTVRDRKILCARSLLHGFGPAVTIAALPAGPSPAALWLGDLDGDGIADACADDTTQIRCVRTR